MHQEKRRFSGLWLAILLTAAVLTGCLPRPAADTATTAAPYPEETAAQYETDQEDGHQASQQFAKLEQEIFLREIQNDQLDLHYLLKNPERYGITQTEHLYSPITEEAFAESDALRQEMKAGLAAIDPALLSEDQRLTYRILESFLRTEDLGSGLDLYVQPLAPTIGIQAQLPILLCEYTLRDKQDVEDYLALLDGLDDYYEAILAHEQRIADAGLMLSDTSIDHVIESCESYLLIPGDNFMLDSFEERLADVPGLTEEEKTAYQERNAAALDQSFVPAYQRLIDGMTALKGTGTNPKGMCGYPDGKAYYTYLVYSATGTSYQSIDDLMIAVEQSIQSSLLETSAILRERPELTEQVAALSFSQTEPEAILKELESLCAADFPALPQCSYTLKNVPESLELSLSPAFYLKSPIDDPAENIIYINRNPMYAEDSLYPTVAHEGYPGHLYQNVYFTNHSTSNLRKILSFPGYSEGWASYVESLSYTLEGNGLDPDLGRLLSANSMATLGIHAYLDLAVNYSGWETGEVQEFLSQFYQEPEDLANAMFEVMIENPANYLSYFVGALEFRNMRQIAVEELGPKFNAKEFHRFLLDIGPAPFDVIQAYFSTWLIQQKL